MTKSWINFPEMKAAKEITTKTNYATGVVDLCHERAKRI